MKGTIIIGCRGLWNYTKKPSKKCILLDEKLFGGREMENILTAKHI